MRPDSSEYGSFYAAYVQLVKSDDPISALEESGELLTSTLSSIDFDPYSNYRYAEGKWSISEVILHLIDAEVVFLSRLMWAARGEQSELPGFNHNQWVQENQSNTESIAELVEWFKAQRRSSQHFARGVSDSQWSNKIIASGNPFTTRSLAFIMSGHVIHHTNILKERYLTQLP